MSARAEAWVEENYRSSTRRGASQRKFVLYMLARSANGNGEVVRETIATIARKVDQDARSVQRHLRELQLEGALQCVIQGKGPTGSAPSIFRIVGVRQLEARGGCLHSSPPCAECAAKQAA